MSDKNDTNKSPKEGPEPVPPEATENSLSETSRAVDAPEGGKNMPKVQSTSGLPILAMGTAAFFFWSDAIFGYGVADV